MIDSRTADDIEWSAVHEGIYELLLTHRIESQLSELAELNADIGPIDPADQPHSLARHLGDLLSRKLESERDPDRRSALVSRVVELLDLSDEAVVPPIRELRALRTPPGPGRSTRFDRRPATPLNDAALLTNTHGEPSLAGELRAELHSADRVDLLCAFIMVRGLRLLDRELTAIAEAGVPLRVVTTTYLGGTEREALDRLAREYGAEVRVQYDVARTRLHAKAWLFERKTGFHTAYVGSSNLSTSALLEGVEWNVRLSQQATPSLMQKFRATFETYWNSSEFRPYDPDRDRDQLDDALLEARGRSHGGRATLTLSGLDVSPFAYQQEMLDALEAERTEHNRHRNLLVAATGTGKTVVAALDYRRLIPSVGQPPSLLFVAHRREILEQAQRTYREVLKDGSFGEAYVGGARPERWRHVFASVQSLTSYGVENIPPDAYDIVVIDEFHHAEARTYQRILDHLQPRELLGLTATPERADGVDVRSYFAHRTAAELRLWDALGADLLCPFHYFAVADGTDLRQLAWSRGRYDDAQLSDVYTGNDARAAIVLEQVRTQIGNPLEMRALGFCVSVAHARYMAEVFNRAGIPATAVSGTTSLKDREQALTDLRERRLNVLFAADLFNEGLDLPDVDTVLFLRPTESATIFLQQLGRGLRRTPDKAVLTVLDFVGFHRKEFRFGPRFQALLGSTRRGLIDQLEKDFPFLPSGCQIVMDRQAQQIVLDNVRDQVGSRWKPIVAELRAMGDVDLETFLDEAEIDLSDVLRRGERSWTALRRDASLPTPSGGELESKLLKRVRAFAHVDDAERHEAYRQLLASPLLTANSVREQRLRRMVTASLWYDGGGFDSSEEAALALLPEEAVRQEIRLVVDLGFDQARRITYSPGDELADIPLRVHAHYQREEILAAIDFPRQPNSFREGVYYFANLNIDAFFITLKKSEADYSPTTMYRDYPISPTLFHWESQSTTSVDSPTGQRYLTGTSTVLLFVREQPQNEFGTAPYAFLGTAQYVSHEGSRPVAITWRLDRPMPPELFAAASAAAA